jgi:hypothetical protein
MTINILELDQICNIADRVYFDVIDHLDLENECIEFDEDTGGTKNTEYGSELYYLIENAVMNAIEYQDYSYTCPKIEPTEE